MQRFVYWLFIVIALPLSRLPLSFLYIFSAPIRFFLQQILSYRRKVILQNLTNSFPGKDKPELDEIINQYYSFLADLIIENIKLLSAGEKEIRQMVKLKNPEILNDLFQQGKSIALVVGHFGNWELGSLILPLDARHKVNVIFKKQRNIYFNNLFNRTRSRTGAMMVEMNQVARVMLAQKPHPEITVFLTDQNPMNQQAAYVTVFLNQKTYVFPGPEKMARKTDQPVVYGAMKKIARGKYEAEFALVTDNPEEEIDGAITQKHTQLLEQSIREQPSNWLWSHRRWRVRGGTKPP